MVSKRFYFEIVTIIAEFVIFLLQVILYFYEGPQDKPVKDSNRVINIECELKSNVASLPKPTRGTKVYIFLNFFFFYPFAVVPKF